MTDGARVRLRPMTDVEFGTWRASAIESYAADVALASGVPLDLATERSQAEFEELLPDGLATQGSWVLKIVDGADGSDVGTLWIGPHPRRPGAAYVFDIEVDAAQRGRGLGRASMLAAEHLVGEAGITEIGLNVFGFNERARRLYDSLGYRVVATQMTKSVAAGESRRDGAAG